MKKIIAIVLVVICMMATLVSCSTATGGSYSDIQNTKNVANTLQSNQPTPTDIDYSLERYNLIRRAYWVNGMRERANSLPCEVTKPVGYVVLFSGTSIVGSFTVDGKVSSLNSFLTPSAKDEYVSNGGVKTEELPDIDGSYGENDAGIFFFTTDGKYIEWTGSYLYSDIPMKVDSPIIKYEETANE